MGIFGALTTSVAGLRANSYALENISGNIANSQTTAFKRIDTSFKDIIPDTGNTAQLAGSVTAGSRSTNTISGSVQAASVATYMAINGDGFFAVQKPGSFSDNNPVFDGVDRYTRRGDFSLDKNGYLVNGAGYFLQGVPIDPTTGNPSGSVPEVLRFQNDFLPSQATTKIDYRANLASYPLTANHETSVPGSELLRPADFASNPRILGTPPAPFTDSSRTGTSQNNKLTVPAAIGPTTTLSGAANSNSIASNFAAGDTITVNGTVVTFVAAGAVGNQLNVTDTIADLLTKIDFITGAGAHRVDGGVGRAHNPYGADVRSDDVELERRGVRRARLHRHGDGAPRRRRHGGHGRGDRQRQPGFPRRVRSAAAPRPPMTATAPRSACSCAGRRSTQPHSASATSIPGTCFYQVNPSATGSAVAWQNVGTDFTFGPNGQMNPVVGQITLNNLTVSGVTLGNVTMAFGTGGLTQFADTNGNAQVNQLQQDGYAAGQLQSVSVSNDGRVVGSYSNGRNIDLAEVSVATFNGADFLKRIDGGAFEVTNESGEALFGKGGSISGSSLESSNTDIADEFTKLIVTQQAYSANTKVITTANTMVQDLLNVMR